MNKTSEDEFEILKWQWAYSNQLYLFDKHDAYWIECAKSGWNSEEHKIEFNLFLTSYGLKRGKIGKYLADKDNRNNLIEICNKIFSSNLSKDIYEDAQQRWNKAVAEIRDDKGFVLASAMLKIFWFYHPDKLPMYDSYVRKALKDKTSKSLDHNNFLIHFAEYLPVGEQQIQKVEKYFNRKSISYPRVVDMYLWLCGSGQDADIIKKYKYSLEKMPLE